MKTIIAISDTHIGSLAGLLPPHGVSVVSGNVVKPNKYQRTLWKYWRHFWEVFVPEQIEGSESTAIVINGDLIDGVHHKTTYVVSTSWTAQENAAAKILAPLCEFGEVFVVRGTEAHSGIGAESEEKIAKELRCAANEVGEYSNWQLWLEVDDVIFQFAHHIGVTSSAAYESSAPMRELVAGLVEAAQWERKLPHVFVRSHRHRFIPVSIPSTHGRLHSVITPGWQLRTPFTERIDRMRMPHIGGVVFRVEGETCEIREKIYPLPDPKPIRI